MERNVYLILFIIGLLLTLFCIIFLVISLFEIYFKSQQRTSAKIHPDKTEKITDNYVYSNKLIMNPMFVTIK